VDPEGVADAVFRMLARHNDYFAALRGSAPRETRAMLTRLAEGPATIDELLGHADRNPDRPDGPLSALQFAINFGLVGQTKRGDATVCHLTMGLLGSWLRFARTNGRGEGRRPAAG